MLGCGGTTFRADPARLGSVVTSVDGYPTVSVVIPAHSSADSLREAVGSALGQSLVAEVVIAVAPSSDTTSEVASTLALEDPRVKVVPNPAGTTPAGLNQAIRSSRGDVIVRLDAHSCLPEGYVEDAVEVLRATGAGNVGGRQVPEGEGWLSCGVAQAMVSPLGAGGATYRTGVEAGSTDTVYLGVFDRVALEAVGGFDERFVRNQDAELNLRLRAAGFDVWFDPRLQVSYRPRATLRGLASQYFQYGRWRRATARIHPGSLRLRQVAAPSLVVAFAGAFVIGATGRRAVPLLLAGTYLGSLVTAIEVLGHRPRLPTFVAVVTMHLSWGLGFLMGPPRGFGGRPSSAEVV